MTWFSWTPDTSEDAIYQLEEDIFSMMCSAVYDFDVPPLDSWLEDLGVGIVGEDIDVIIYYELEEIDVGTGETAPGYTLTVQCRDGQPFTESFFADDSEDLWRESARSAAESVISLLGLNQ